MEEMIDYSSLSQSAELIKSLDHSQKNIVKPKLTEILREIHEVSYVHRDFRDSDILINIKILDVQVVDCDNCGMEGRDVYPAG